MPWGGKKKQQNKKTQKNPTIEKTIALFWLPFL